MLISQRRKSKSGRLSNLLIGHAAIKRQSQDLNPGLPAAKAHSLFTIPGYPVSKGEIVYRGRGNHFVQDFPGCLLHHTSSSDRRRGPDSFEESWFA